MTEQPSATSTMAPSPSPSGAANKPGKASPYIWGTGRRKTAVARVRIRPGAGMFMINSREVEKFFTLEKDQMAVLTPLRVTDSAKNLDVFVNVSGGGVTGQAGAIVLGLARALVKANPDHESALRDNHLLTRDARKVERKKYGRPGARKRFQFSKR